MNRRDSHQAFHAGVVVFILAAIAFALFGCQADDCPFCPEDSLVENSVEYGWTTRSSAAPAATSAATSVIKGPAPQGIRAEDHGYAHMQSYLDYLNAQIRQGSQLAIERAWSHCWDWRRINDLVKKSGQFSPEPRGCPVESPFE